MQVIIIIILILAILLVIFTLQNSMDITLNIFFWEISNVPLVLVLICCVLLGYLIAAMYFAPKLWKVKKEYKQLSRFNNELEGINKPEHLLDDDKIDKIREEESNHEGIELDDNDDSNSFFKD